MSAAQILQLPVLPRCQSSSARGGLEVWGRGAGGEGGGKELLALKGFWRMDLPVDLISPKRSAEEIHQKATTHECVEAERRTQPKTVAQVLRDVEPALWRSRVF